MKQLFFLALALVPFFSVSQSITSGPVVGGVTSESARIYIRTDVPAEFDLELDTLLNFATSFSISDSTRSNQFNSVIAEVNDLEPFKKYYYRYLIDGQAQDSVYSFTSFPQDGDLGHYKIVVGSCNYFENFPLFGHIKAFDPMLFIHLGDWRYPPSTFGWDYNLFPDRIANAFSFRYNDPNMSGFVLNNTAIDYVYDDSYCHNGNQGNTFPSISTTQLAPDSFFYDLITVEFDSAVIPGAIEGYFDHFPAYESVDTAVGIHHSFKMGNVEFFMLDLRNPSSPQNEAFVYHPETNLYSFEPDSNHSLMGSEQREWLLNGLQNSTADWKIIGSSVMFNKRFQMFMDAAIQIQALDNSLIEYAWSLAYFWHAYPADLNGVLDFVEENDIRDVIVVSGDSHSSMVDDGTNAGLPELSASGLASEDEGFLNYELDSVMELVGFNYGTIDSLWNGGGSGVGNSNFSDSYGTVEVWGKDSIMLCAIDENGQELGCVRVYHSSNPLSAVSKSRIVQDRLYLVYPNPAKDLVQVELARSYQPSAKAMMQLTSTGGHTVQYWRGSDVQHKMAINLSELSAGNYTLTLFDEGQSDSRNVVISR